MRKRILLLEDEQAIADTLLYALQSEGFEVQHSAWQVFPMTEHQDSNNPLIRV